jgi:hypothetical protein
LREKQEGKGEMLPKPKKNEFGSLLGVMSSLYLQNMSLSCKNSKQKLAGNAAKTPKKLQNDSDGVAGGMAILWNLATVILDRYFSTRWTFLAHYHVICSTKEGVLTNAYGP